MFSQIFCSYEIFKSKWSFWRYAEKAHLTGGINNLFLFPSVRSSISNLKSNDEKLQVNLCQKLLFLHQLTHNMTTDCWLNYNFNTWKFQARTWGDHVVYRNCFRHSEQFLYITCSPPCSAKRRASDKDLPVHTNLFFF